MKLEGIYVPNVVPLAAEPIRELARHPRIIGMKDSSRDLSGFLTLMQEIRAFRPEFIFFTGTEEILLPALFMGATGGTIATAGCLPEAVSGIYQAWRQGDAERARLLQRAMLPLIKLMFSVDFPLGFRAAVELRGFTLGSCRQPLSAGQEKAVAKLKEALTPVMSGILKEGGASQV